MYMMMILLLNINLHRSLFHPENPAHDPAQVAWSWLWDNIEQLLKATLGKPAVPWYVGLYMSQADVCLTPKQVIL